MEENNLSSEKIDNVETLKNKSSFELEINKIFENSYEFKRKVLNTFGRVENFISKILYPSVKQTSYSDVIKTLKKTSKIWSSC